MTTESIQAELQNVIDTLTTMRRASERERPQKLEDAIEKLSQLKKDVVQQTGIGGFAGGPPLFHKDQQS